MRLAGDTEVMAETAPRTDPPLHDRMVFVERRRISGQYIGVIVGLLLMAWATVAIGTYAATMWTPLLVALAVIFTAIGVIKLVVPRRLQLDREGLTYGRVLRATRCSWQDCTRIWLHGGAALPEVVWAQRKGATDSSRDLVHHVLPDNFVGIGAAELAVLMDAYRRAHAAKR